MSMKLIRTVRANIKSSKLAVSLAAAVVCCKYKSQDKILHVIKKTYVQ